MDFGREGHEAEQEQQYIEFEQDEETVMASGTSCEVMVQTTGGEFDSFHKSTPIHFRVSGELTGQVERWAPETVDGKGVIKRAEVRLADGSTLFVPVQSILEPGPYGGLFPVEDIEEA